MVGILASEKEKTIFCTFQGIVQEKDLHTLGDNIDADANFIRPNQWDDDEDNHYHYMNENENIDVAIHDRFSGEI